MGNITFESGVYDTSSHDIVKDAQLKLYEVRSGISSAAAAKVGLPPGPSFYTALNDTIYFDNRIPPRGFRFEAFREYRAEPVSYSYQDGQYWDETQYSLPRETQTVEASVYYQVASKEFVEFLRDENRGNPYDWNNWGEKTYQAWQLYGKPVCLAREEIRVLESMPELPPVKDFSLPVSFVLAQNYPNPFNASSTIEFWISERSSVLLSVYDVAGKIVETLVDAELPAGLHSAQIVGSNLASGVYFYRLSVLGISETKKFLLMR